MFATAQAFCAHLLQHGDLASKLLPPRGADQRLLPFDEQEPAPLLPDTPARDAALALGPSEEAERLPTLGQLTQATARATCLIRFAHHELQAIELFAWAVLRFPALPLPLRRGFLLVLEEEQIHLRLYVERLAALGQTLTGGLSDYLWRHRARIESADDPALAFLCALGLTFEQANLDFAGMYRDAFRQVGDDETAAVLDRVHRDEIRHVRLALRWLNRLKRSDETSVQAYLRAVPFPLGLARAKGRRLDLVARRQAGLDDGFIQQLINARPYEPAPRLDAARPLWLLPNLGAEEADRPLPAAARGFLRGVQGAWASLFPAERNPCLLPPGEASAQAAWRAALPAPSLSHTPTWLTRLFGTVPPGTVVAWLNTPGAAAHAAAHQTTLWGPAPAIVRSVHDKAFAQQVAQECALQPTCLDGLITVFAPALCQQPQEAEAMLRAHLATWPDWTNHQAVLKPRMGTSGRGHTFVALHRQTGQLAAPLAADKWQALAQAGGCVVEPWLTRTCDLSVQLAIYPGEGIEVLGTTQQVVTPRGMIRGNRGLFGTTVSAGVGAEVEAQLTQAATEVARAAQRQGYVGIAGVDAFLFRGPAGQVLLRPIVEFNARFTTGTLAVVLAARAREHLASSATAWAFLLRAPKVPLDTPRCQLIAPLAAGPLLVLADAADGLDPLCALPQANAPVQPPPG